MHGPKTKECKTNKRSSLLARSKRVDQNKLNVMQTDQETIMDIRRVEQIEREDPSQETQNLTNRWRELVEPEKPQSNNYNATAQRARGHK